jgi:hypothetical protein
VDTTETNSSSFRPTGSPWSALALLLVGYGLVLLAPIAFQSLRVAVAGLGNNLSVASWVPIAAAVGLALLGGAAMVVVLARLVGELEQHPFAGIAAPLGVLMGAALIALRAPLHLGPLDSGSCAVVCLFVVIAGGALAQRISAFSAVLGGLIALAPAPLLMTSLWSQTGFAPTLQGLLAAQTSSDRTFLGLLGLFSVLLLGLAMLARRARRAQAERGSEQWPAETLEARSSSWATVRTEEAMELTPLLLTRKRASAEPIAVAPNAQIDLGYAPTIQAPLQPRPFASPADADLTPRVSVWSFHDAPPKPEDFELPSLNRGWGQPALWVGFGLLAVVAVAVYAVMFR